MKEEAVPKWETQELQRRFQSLTLEFKKLHRVPITSSQKCPSLRTAREETEVRILLLSPRRTEKTTGEPIVSQSPDPIKHLVKCKFWVLTADTDLVSQQE